MNIFVTNANPIASAQELCDAHVRSKMIIESAIMLQHCFDPITLSTAPRTKSGKLRKSGGGYYNHVCSRWVRLSIANFDWLVTHALAMCDERVFRWPEKGEHFTRTFIEWCREHRKETNLPNLPLTPWVMAVNEKAICCTRPHIPRDEISQSFHYLPIPIQYQEYLIHDKTSLLKWTKRPAPNWFIYYVNTYPQYFSNRLTPAQIKQATKIDITSI